LALEGLPDGATPLKVVGAGDGNFEPTTYNLYSRRSRSPFGGSAAIRFNCPHRARYANSVIEAAEIEEIEAPRPGLQVRSRRYRHCLNETKHPRLAFQQKIDSARSTPPHRHCFH
jgi:hypothetical protein